MVETIRTVLFVISLILIFLLVMFGQGWWIDKIGNRIIEELKSKGATSEMNAISLPYAKANYFKIGFRDYRPKALEILMTREIICRTEDGRYYVNRLS